MSVTFHLVPQPEVCYCCKLSDGDGFIAHEEDHAFHIECLRAKVTEGENCCPACLQKMNVDSFFPFEERAKRSIKRFIPYALIAGIGTAAAVATAQSGEPSVIVGMTVANLAIAALIRNVEKVKRAIVISAIGAFAGAVEMGIPASIIETIPQIAKPVGALLIAAGTTQVIAQKAGIHPLVPLLGEVSAVFGGTTLVLADKMGNIWETFIKTSLFAIKTTAIAMPIKFLAEISGNKLGFIPSAISSGISVGAHFFIFTKIPYVGAAFKFIGAEGWLIPTLAGAMAAGIFGAVTPQFAKRSFKPLTGFLT